MPTMYTALPYPEVMLGFLAVVVGVALGTLLGVAVAYLIVMLTQGRFWE